MTVSGLQPGDDAGFDAAAVADGGPGSDSSAPACDQAFGVSSVVPLTSSADAGAQGVAWTGSSFAVAWQEWHEAQSPGDTGAYRIFFSTIGKATRSEPLKIAEIDSAPRLVATSTGFVALYEDRTRGISSLALGPSGTPTGKPATLTGAGEGVALASAASSGSAVLAVWDGIGVIHHVLVGHALQAQFDGNADGIGGIWSAVWAGDRFAIAWRGFHVGPGGVYLGEIGADGVAGDLITVWPSDADVTNDKDFGTYGALPSLAWTGSEYRLAWTAGSQLLTARVPRGGPADAPVKSTFDSRTLRSGAPLWDGAAYGALVTHGGGLGFARFTPAGAPTGPTLTLDPAETSGTLIHTGREYAATWSSPTGAYFARIGTCP